MKRRAIVFAGSAVAGLIAIAAIAQQQSGESDVDGVTFFGEPVTSDEIALGQDLYAANCASCHGVDLEGQPDWKRRLDSDRMPAPPHDETGHTWHHADRQLFIITKLGVGGVVPGYESDMPAFEGMLTDAEIRAVLAFIKSTWPDRQRAFQAEVTANDEGGS
ncbi:cytochrome c [uncultured Jannaschia sp.]|uniref:c-type cytochrome n=1 Tax=uncultured Jannaschia sp. TaxID=293347 RepID=UPI00263A15BB|nr:cytochrome c [uncultured Jannaschia sp.]